MTDLMDKIYRGEVATPSYDEFLALCKTPPKTGVAKLRFTPEVAAAILANNNGHNRSKNVHNKKKLRRQGFQQTGDTIKFARWSAISLDKLLLDGQHRLDYAVASGETIEVFVVFDLDPDVFPYLDSGKNRTKIDTFEVAGVSYFNYVASAVRWIALYDDMKPGGKPDKDRRIDNDEQFYLYSNFSQERKDLLHLYIGKLKKIKCPELPTSVLAAHLVVFHEVDADAADQMFTDILNHRRGKLKRGEKKTYAEILIQAIGRLMADTGTRIHEWARTARIVITFNAYKFGSSDLTDELTWDRSMPYPDYKDRPVQHADHTETQPEQHASV
jgi:hypothetical protein